MGRADRDSVRHARGKAVETLLRSFRLDADVRLGVEGGSPLVQGMEIVAELATMGVVRDILRKAARALLWMAPLPGAKPATTTLTVSTWSFGYRIFGNSRASTPIRCGRNGQWIQQNYSKLLGRFGMFHRYQLSRQTRLLVTGASFFIATLAVFSVARAQTLATLSAFDSTDGANPQGSLILNGSTLYGMTEYGGDNGDGTIFSVPVSGGTPTVLYSFDGDHGENPYGSLTLSGSTLYGMTSAGGANSDGTVFSVSVAGGTPTVLYSFDGDYGENPYGSLTLSGSTLYGMTSAGGTDGLGTVFKIPITGGTPTTLYSFDATHGGVPQGSLILSGSTLYGMTQVGGTSATSDGTVFAIPVTGGTPTVLYSFDGTYGENPGVI